MKLGRVAVMLPFVASEALMTMGGAELRASKAVAVVADRMRVDGRIATLRAFREGELTTTTYCP